MSESPDRGQLSLPVIDISPFISWDSPESDDHATNPDTPKETEHGNGAAHPQARLPKPTTAAHLTPTQRTTVAALRAAVQHPGFFYLTGHGVPCALMQRVLSLGRQFYTAPDSLPPKRSIARRPCGDRYGDGARGWQDVDAVARNDWHEALDFYAEIAGAEQVAAHRAFKAARPDVWPGVDGLLEGRNLYPPRPAAMRDVYPDYVARLCSVGEAVMRALGFALELRDPEFFVGATRDSFWCLRVLGYPPLPPAFRKKEGEDDDEEDEEMVGCGAHSDYGCLTMLLTDDTPGALKKSNGSTPTPSPGAYVVNIGDMVEQWTGGWATSTVHKVLHHGDGYRISVPFFYEPAKHVVVRRLPEFGGTEADPEVRYWDHLVSKIDGSFFRKRTTW
ncbi:naringenin-2-oxoglutarate 3-dioxygenase [Apiospora aurea]|uniref:Naringenin-2-oxoglutarate 3-dioxygenase n=1 Tax=Apiospora aurea TaxID=335848 RepID=A0ABR1QWA9_9PEZI